MHRAPMLEVAHQGHLDIIEAPPRLTTDRVGVQKGLSRVLSRPVPGIQHRLS